MKSPEDLERKLREILGTTRPAGPVAGMDPRGVRDTFGAPRPGGRTHAGVDIPAGRGTPVLAPGSGVVEAVGNEPGGAGYYAKIRDEAGELHEFYHLDRPASVRLGQRVTAGHQIGGVGSTGRSTGYHLHYGIRDPGGVAVNPYKRLTERLPQTTPPEAGGGDRILAKLRENLSKRERPPSAPPPPASGSLAVAGTPDAAPARDLGFRPPPVVGFLGDQPMKDIRPGARNARLPARALARGAGVVTEHLGHELEAIPEAAGVPSPTGGDPTRIFPAGARITTAVQGAGRAVARAGERIQGAVPAYGKGPSDPVWWVEQPIEQIPRLLGAFGASRLGGRSAAGRMLGFGAPIMLEEAGASYEKAKALGADPVAAARAAQRVGIGNALLESTLGITAGSVLGRFPVVRRIFSERLMQSALGKIGGTGIEEGLEEGLQNAWATVNEYMVSANPEAWDDFWKNTATEMAVGGLVGGVFGVGRVMLDRAAELPQAVEGPPPSADLRPSPTQVLMGPEEAAAAIAAQEAAQEPQEPAIVPPELAGEAEDVVTFDEEDEQRVANEEVVRNLQARMEARAEGKLAGEIEPERGPVTTDELIEQAEREGVDTSRQGLTVVPGEEREETEIGEEPVVVEDLTDTWLDFIDHLEGRGPTGGISAAEIMRKTERPPQAALTTAREQGREAFEAGQQRIPPGSLLPLQMQEWLRGWDNANLAAPVPESAEERGTEEEEAEQDAMLADFVYEQVVQRGRSSADVAREAGVSTESVAAILEQELGGATAAEMADVDRDEIHREPGPGAKPKTPQLTEGAGGATPLGLTPEPSAPQTETEEAPSDEEREPPGQVGRAPLREPEEEPAGRPETVRPEGPRGVPEGAERPGRGEVQPDREPAPAGEEAAGGVPRAGAVSPAEPSDREGVRAERPRPGARPRDREGDEGRVQGRDTPRNYRLTEDEEVAEGGQKTRARNNLRALEILKQVDDGRTATPEEQAEVVKYVGWGSMPQIFDSWRSEWNDEREQLKQLLTDEEYEAARASTLNAHYTSLSVIGRMWEGLQRLGISGRVKVLEPAAGVGHFIGMTPEGVDARWTAVELDSMTGRLAKILYPRADVRVQGFEEAVIPDESIDVVVTNVPFGNYKLHDPRYNALKLSIHDYFFAKALDKLRPGGVMMAITSMYTMDRKAGNVRRYIGDRANLLAAIRLPNTAFKANAGTEVTTDILILQKRAKGEARSGPDWFETVPHEGITINEYYAANPGQMLGTMEMTGTMYAGRGREPTLEPPEGQNLPAEIERLMMKLPQGVFQREAPREDAPAEQVLAPTEVKEGAFTVRDGKLYRKMEGMLEPVSLGATQERRVRDLMELRGATRALMHAEMEDAPTVDALRKDLNKRYDTFRKKHGPINKTAGNRQPNLIDFREDPDVWLVAALENYDEDTGQAKKAPIFHQRVIRPVEPIERVEQPQDAIPVVLSERGHVDLDRIAELAGTTVEKATEDLKGAIYRDPTTGQWQTDDEYLSGNVREKLEIAQTAAKTEPAFRENAEALEKVQPEDLEPVDISVYPGAAWITPEDYQDFFKTIVGRIKVAYIPKTATYIVQGGNLRHDVKNTDEWGVPGATAVRLWEDLLNQRQTTVWATEDGKRVKDRDATMLARAKQDEIKARFQEWLWQDGARATRLARVYNDTQNNLVDRVYNGDHLKLSGSSAAIKLDPHQKSGIWRILSAGNTLLAHVVGGGKTYTMVAAGMEARRLGLARKPMYAVPNHMLNQFARELLELYPRANILVADEHNFQGSKRKAFTARIATGDWDAVILTHSAFGMIPMSKAFREDALRRELDSFRALLDEVKAEGADRRTIKQIENAIKKLEEQLRKLQDKKRDDVLDFEELGVDMLFVDEAHEFKNLITPTKIEKAGLSTSQKAYDLLLKTQFLHQRNPGRGVVFATGTPISNSITEMYVMQRYLQPDYLVAQGFEHFDAWAAMFAETVTGVEALPEGGGYRMYTRFARFRNVPELSRQFRRVADVKMAKDLNLKVPKVVAGGGRLPGETVVAPPSPELDDFIENELSPRAEAIRGGQVRPDEDNMLKVSGDGRRASLDMRLVRPDTPEDLDSKVNMAAENIYRTWKESATRKLTQLVFIDMSTPKKDVFNVYDDLKAKLVKMGIPASEIAYIHDAKNHKQKSGLFGKVRKGDIRVFFGSTAKMGMGTNVQDRVVALHHLDAPWKPAEVEQRDGRMVRRGNQNEEVHVFRYLTRGSFDEYMWQTLERKAGFIAQVMTGDTGQRVIENVDEVVLSVAEVKALASKNPLVLEKVRVDSDLLKLDQQRRAHTSRQIHARQKVSSLPARLKALRERLAGVRADMAAVVDTSGDKFKVTIGKKTYTDRVKAGEALAKIRDEVAAAGHDGRPVTGSFAGLELKIRYQFGGADLILAGNEEYAVETANTSPAGLVARLERIPDRIGGVAARVEEEIASEERALEDFQRLAREAFAKEADYKALSARSAAISAELDVTNKKSRQTDDTADDLADDRETEGGYLDLGRRRRDQREPLVTSTLDEVEQRWQAAKGIKQAPIRRRILESLRGVGRSFSRHFPHLHTKGSPKIAVTQEYLRQVEAAPMWAKTMAHDRVAGVVGGLSAEQLDLFTRNLVLPDMIRSAEEGVYGEPDETGRFSKPLPFGYPTLEAMQADLDHYRAAARADKAVTEALQKRQRFSQALAYRLVELEFLPAKVLEDDRYYHRQVMAYVSAQDPAFIGASTGEDVRLRKKGFQRRRLGGGDFNTAYQEAEFEWVAQAYSIIARKEALLRIQQLNDIKGDLKVQAKLANMHRLVEKLNPIEATAALQPYRRAIGRANKELAQAAAEGELTTPSFEPLVEDFADAYRSWEADKDDSGEPFRFEHPQWFPFLAELAADDESGGAIQARSIFKAIREREALIQEELGADYKTWRGLIPDTHEAWQPERGNHFYFGLTAEERILDKAIEEGRVLEKDEYRQALIMGGRKEEWVIPSELAATLDEFRPTLASDPMDRIWTQAQSSWKQWVLLNPFRWLKYNTNNLSGDLDIAVAYDPKILKHAPRGSHDLARWTRQRGAPMVRLLKRPPVAKGVARELEMWQRKGVIDSGLTIAEIPEINETGVFRALTSQDANVVQTLIGRYWDNVRGFTVWRENVLRLAAARYFQAELGKGKKLYGASRRHEIDAIKDVDDRAAKLARELIGDYGNISRAGQWLRRHMIPFYSWIEINSPRYYRLLKNLPAEGRGRGGPSARAATGLGLRVGLRAGLLAVQANLLFFFVYLWNRLFFPEEDREIRRQRRGPHLILGRREDGSIISLRFEGALADMLEWLDLHDYPDDIKDVQTGKADWLDKVAEAPKSVIERGVNSLNPFIKTVVEQTTGRSTYPHFLEKGKSFRVRGGPPIRDRGEAIAGMFSLNRLYSRVVGKPQPPGSMDLFQQLLLYRTDPDEAAYWYSRDLAVQWARDKGREFGSVTPSERSNTLYYHKRAVQWGDEKAAAKWLKRYYELGGTDTGLTQSLQASHPLGTIARKDRADFLGSLDAEDRRIVDRAQDWYRRIYGAEATSPSGGRRRRRSRSRRR